jgi:gamma-glutamylcyclotransferase (GGCT)/AIG2-like uncharacterized protein YtfP
MKVAVYGSLVKGMHNHDYYLGKAKYVGEYYTTPDFTLYSLNSFPGLKKNGCTSIRMEVYDVSKIELKRIDSLEGYVKSNPNNHYERTIMKTPYGRAIGYEYNHPVKGLPVVSGGCWKQFKRLQKVDKHV